MTKMPKNNRPKNTLYLENASKREEGEEQKDLSLLLLLQPPQ